MRNINIKNQIASSILFSIVLFSVIMPDLLIKAHGQIVDEQCDVIVVGGSQSALFAAIAASKEGKDTCLIEPTDWIGGQLTVSGVPAIDWQWMNNINPSNAVFKNGVDGNTPHRLRANNNYLFYDWIAQITPKGSCTVSRDCFLPTDILQVIYSYINNIPNLKVFNNTVVKDVLTSWVGTRLDYSTNQVFDLKKIFSIKAIARSYRSSVPLENRYKKRLSSDINEWYSEFDSADFTKNIVNFTGKLGNPPVVVEASEFGDAMVLSGAPYLQGNEKFDGSIETANESCGQSSTFTFNMKMNPTVVPENNLPLDQVDSSYGDFNFGNGTWDTNWTYRRLSGSGTGDTAKVPAGETTVMNWKSFGNNGNDYAKKYLFKSYSDALQERSNWKGGIDQTALKGVEDLSYYFYHWLKQTEPRGDGPKLSVDNPTMGTNNGLYKMPYMRDIRRSIGIDNYLLKTSEMLAQKPTGFRYMDRVATANYPFDIHPIDNCQYSNDDIGNNYKQGVRAEPYPFYISFRSLTNKSIVNMLVAGKSMAQSFKASASTRLQPGEATSGTAAGVAAAYMATNNLTTYNIVEPTNDTYRSSIGKIQTLIKKYQPIDWSIGGVTYPSSTEYLKNIRTNYYCPQGAVVDLSEGWCYDENNAYGPFPKAMVDKCIAYGGGPACSELKSFQAGSKTINAQRWSKLFARNLRGDDICALGSAPALDIKDHCIEQGSIVQVYGPFTVNQVESCNKTPAQGGLGGGNACYTNRYSYNFTKTMLAKP